MAMTSQKTLDLPLIPCGWSLFLMEQLTKQGLQLTFLKVNVNSQLPKYALLITSFCTRKKYYRIWKICFNLLFSKINSVLSPAYFLPGHEILSNQNSWGISISLWNVQRMKERIQCNFLDSSGSNNQLSCETPLKHT